MVFLMEDAATAEGALAHALNSCFTRSLSQSAANEGYGRSIVGVTKSERERTIAEQRFASAQRAENERSMALKEWEQRSRAQDQKTERLRALRLAKEAADLAKRERLARVRAARTKRAP